MFAITHSCVHIISNFFSECEYAAESLFLMSPKKLLGLEDVGLSLATKTDKDLQSKVALLQ